MRIHSVEPFDRDHLLAQLRRTRLRGFDGARVYEGAALSLEPALDPEALAPAQRYVLTDGIERILALRTALLPHGLDLLALDGGAYVTTDDGVVPVIPPVVEESREPDGRTVLIVNDGIHRVYAARSLGLHSAVVARGASHPYYALALPGGWADVTALDALPDRFEKKAYRDPQNYKALFRDFNGVFPGVQQQRKRSNPEHLTA